MYWSEISFVTSGLVQYILWSFCAHSPFPLSLLHASPNSSYFLTAQAVLCEYTVLVIQSLHEELGVFPSALLCPHLGEI